jgi:aryl-alcohol dehydrogenase-like predicted oxidoreductase
VNAVPRSSLEQRALGRSGLTISTIGFGAWGIGGLTPNATSYGQTDDAVSRQALLSAFAAGVDFFDTSPAYGRGRSERLIGETLADVRENIKIATKGGIRNFDEPIDFSPAGLDQTLDESLRRLKTGYVDLYQLHNPTAAVLNAPDPVATLINGLRRDGVIRAFGVSVARPEDGLTAMDRLEIDSIQVNFNLVDQRIIDCGLLDKARARNIAIIARTPLCFGLLSGAIPRDAEFDPTDHRSRWPKAQINYWIDAAGRFGEIVGHDETAGQTNAQLALRYCISFPGVATTIPGMMNDRDVTENVRAGALGPLPERALAIIRETYNAETFFLGSRTD